MKFFYQQLVRKETYTYRYHKKYEYTKAEKHYILFQYKMHSCTSSKIEVDKAGVKIQGKKINVNQNCQEAQIKEEPCDAKAQLVDILINKNEGKKEDAIDKILQMHSYEFLRRYFSKGLKKFND